VTALQDARFSFPMISAIRFQDTGGGRQALPLEVMMAQLGAHGIDKHSLEYVHIPAARLLRRAKDLIEAGAGRDLGGREGSRRRSISCATTTAESTSDGGAGAPE